MPNGRPDAPGQGGRPDPRRRDRENVANRARQLADVLENRAFTDMIDEVANEPRERRAEAARQRSNRGEMRRRGLNHPRDVKVRVRWFEEETDETIVEVEEEPES